MSLTGRQGTELAFLCNMTQDARMLSTERLFFDVRVRLTPGDEQLCAPKVLTVTVEAANEGEAVELVRARYSCDAPEVESVRRDW